MFSAQIDYVQECVVEYVSSGIWKNYQSYSALLRRPQTAIVKQLKRDMKLAAKNLEFERAHEIKKTLFGLQHIQDMA